MAEDLQRDLVVVDHPIELDVITNTKELHDDSAKSPTSLKIKIKLPDRKETAEYDEMKNEDDAEDLEYACSLCGKGFRSRKALGGHMRVHAQQHRRNDDLVLHDHQLTSSDMEDDDDALAENDCMINKATRCPICERDFPSNKALFGHMRCHPERTWRGIQPPAPLYNYNSSSSSSTVSDIKRPPADDIDDDEEEEEVVKQVVVDLEKDLLGFGWGAKAIRGRDAIATKSSSSSVPPPAGMLFGDLLDVEPEQVDGVQSLILLSHGDGGRKLLRPAVCGSSVRDTVNYMMNNKKLILKSNHHSGLEETNRGMKRKNYSQGPLPADEDRYQEEVMNDPNKKFKVTDDALLPHGCYNAAADLLVQTADAKMEMHKVRKYLMVNKDFKGVSDNISLLQLPPHSYPVTKKSTSSIHLQVGNMDHQVERHKCTTCNKCFSSHQALGGHKSSHNKLRNSNTPTPSSKPNNIHHPENYSTVTTQAQGVEAGSSHGDQGLLTVAPSGAIHPLHQCNVCFKIYPSGQALGGHKRLHCTTTSTPLISKTPPQHSSLSTLLHPNMVTAGVLPSLPLAVPSIVVPAQPPQVADTPLAPAAPLVPPAVVSPDNKGVVFRDFDLNEPPPLEEDDTDTSAAEQPQPQQQKQQESDHPPAAPSWSASALSAS